MGNKTKYFVIGIYLLINLLVILFTRNLVYFNYCIGLTSIALGLIYRFIPQLFGSKYKRSLFIYPIISGAICIIFANY